MPILQDEIEEYVAEYEKYIEYHCRKRYSFLHDQIEDMKQFIITELIATYHKKYKYDDFDWVTRTIIRRKAIDFTTNFCSRNENLIFENQAKEHTGGHGSGEEKEVINSFFIAKSMQEHHEAEQNENIIDEIKHLFYQISNAPLNEYFSDWERDFVGMIIELYESGCTLEKDDLCLCMGYELKESHKFNVKLNLFRSKIKKYIENEDIEDGTEETKDAET